MQYFLFHIFIATEPSYCSSRIRQLHENSIFEQVVAYKWNMDSNRNLRSLDKIASNRIPYILMWDIRTYEEIA